jgi:phosphoribosylformylglycinamidine synthase
MFNDFKGYDADNNPVHIAIPPTLLISGIGVMEDVAHAVSIDPKQAGDLIYLLGETKDELGGSEYYDHLGYLGNNVPKTDIDLNYKLYQALSAVNKQQLCASAMATGFGGVGVTLAKKAIAGNLGMDITLDGDLRLDKALYSESQGRIVVTIAPQDKDAFESAMEDYPHIQQIGTVTESPVLTINNQVAASTSDLEKAYKETLGSY